MTRLSLQGWWALAAGPQRWVWAAKGLWGLCCPASKLSWVGQRGPGSWLTFYLRCWASPSGDRSEAAHDLPR